MFYSSVEKDFSLGAEMTPDTVQPPFPGLVDADKDGKSYIRVGMLAERRIINEWKEIPLQDFKKLFQAKAGDLWPKVEKLCEEYGAVLSVPVCSALLYAEEDKKLPWCISLLEGHFESDLSFVHPQLRGRLTIGGAMNRSQAFIEEEIIKVLRPQFFTT